MGDGEGNGSSENWGRREQIEVRVEIAGDCGGDGGPDGAKECGRRGMPVAFSGEPLEFGHASHKPCRFLAEDQSAKHVRQRDSLRVDGSASADLPGVDYSPGERLSPEAESEHARFAARGMLIWHIAGESSRAMSSIRCFAFPQMRQAKRGEVGSARSFDLAGGQVECA